MIRKRPFIVALLLDPFPVHLLMLSILLQGDRCAGDTCFVDMNCYILCIWPGSGDQVCRHEIEERKETKAASIVVVIDMQRLLDRRWFYRDYRASRPAGRVVDRLHWGGEHLIILWWWLWRSGWWLNAVAVLRSVKWNRCSSGDRRRSVWWLNQV